MRKEIYSAKCPKRLQFGDPMYFEEFKGEKLASLVADCRLPRHFAARGVLKEAVLYHDYLHGSGGKPECLHGRLYVQRSGGNRKRDWS